RSALVLLELIDGVEHTPVGVDRQEGRVRAGIHRADSLQLAGAPVHADEIDPFGPGAFGVCANVDEVIILPDIVAQRGIVRATREPDETDRRHGEEVAARRLARIDHRTNLRDASIGARTALPGVTPSTARSFATTDTPFTITC